MFTYASKLNSFPIERVSATKMAKILLNSFGSFLVKDRTFSTLLVLLPKNVDGSSAKAHTSPKTVHSCGKTKFPSHLTSQCPQMLCPFGIV